MRTNSNSKYLLGIFLATTYCTPAMADWNNASFGFAAPNVNNKSNYSQPEFGAIVLDTSDGTFYGNTSSNSASPSWVALSSPSAASEPNLLQNLGLSVTASSGTITISLKQADGSTDPAAGSGAVKIAFRDATSANGDYSLVTITSSLSATLAGATTLGAASGTAVYVYVYAFNNAGTVTLEASLNAYDEGSVQSSSTTTNSNQVIYQASALSNKAIRLIGRFKATNTTNSWASPTEVSLQPFQNGSVAARGTYTTASAATANAWTALPAMTIAFDTHNALSTSTYTVPIAGVYHVSAVVNFANNQTVGARIKVNGSIYSTVLVPSSTITLTSSTVTSLVKAAVGDTISFEYYVTNSGTFDNSNGGTMVDIFRVGL